MNPSIVQRAKHRGLSSVGYSNEKVHFLTESDENRAKPSKINHLLQFDDDHDKMLKSRAQQQIRSGMKRMMTEAIECEKVRCVAKSDLKNLKVAVIGIKLL